MHTPKKRAEEPNLTVVPESATQLTNSDEEQQITFGSGGGPPNQSLMKVTGVLWVFFAFGALLVAISLVALSNDPATSTYRQSFLPSFGDFRIFCELSFLVVGSACMFPSIVCLRALARARKIEKGADGRVKSLRAKKLEKISDDGILGIVGTYIAALLR